MVIISYFTKNFFEELVKNDIDDKVAEHLLFVSKNKNIFFIGHKKIYEDLIKKNKEKIYNNQRKSNLVISILKNPNWIDLPFDNKNLNNLFLYLNKKKIKLDFIFCSNNERLKKIGEIKELKKKTFNKVIHPKKIIMKNIRLLNLYNKIISSTYQIEYKPLEKLESVKKKKEFEKWSENINKAIFVSDKILIYDRYIAKNLIQDDLPKKPFNSDDYFLTIQHFSKYIENCFVGKRNFHCHLICVFEKQPFKNESKINYGVNKEIKWNFLKSEIESFLDNLKSVNRKIEIKDWMMWNLIHDRYIKFYLGESLIKTIKFDPGFDFIKKSNRDRFKDKNYEFDNVDTQASYKKELKFKQLINEKPAYLLEKAS